MNDMQRTRIRREADRQAVIACKTAIVSLRDFVQAGEPLSPGVAEILLHRHDDVPVTGYANLQIVPEVRAWIDQHIPMGFFTTPEEIAAWCAHRGLSDALHSDRIWFWMASDWWNPKRLPRTA